MEKQLYTSHIFPSIEHSIRSLYQSDKNAGTKITYLTNIRIERNGSYYFVACILEHNLEKVEEPDLIKYLSKLYERFVTKCYEIQNLWIYSEQQIEEGFVRKCTINISEEARMKLICKFPHLYEQFKRIETFI